MLIGYIPGISFLIVALAEIVVSLRLHKLVWLSESSYFALIGLGTLFIFSLDDLNSFSVSSIIACIFLGAIVLQGLYEEYQYQTKYKRQVDCTDNK